MTTKKGLLFATCLAATLWIKSTLLRAFLLLVLTAGVPIFFDFLFATSRFAVYTFLLFAVHAHTP